MNNEHLGMGVMIGMLSGNAKTVDTVKSSLGKIIETVELKDDDLKFLFTDGTGMILRDDGQSCCEHRYMVCDDDLTSFWGDTLVNIELKDAPEVEDEYGTHEVQFLQITTNKGTFQCANHNEHNGYYGGFWIVAKPLIAGQQTSE
jgi:hypothetical protein